MQEEEKSETVDKPSLLSTEQVVWINCLLLALFVGRISLNHYTFANEGIERFTMTIWILLFVCAAIVVSIGPKSTVRRISLLLAIPMAILSSIAGCVSALDWNEHPQGVGIVGRAGDVTFQIVRSFDVTYDGISRQFIELRMERPILNGFLKERETLISVQPAEDADVEMIDGGKKIRFHSPALLGRKVIVRTYSTDWDKARKNGEETIPLTKVEQGP